MQRSETTRRRLKQAVQHHVGSTGQQKLRKLLIEGGKQRAERDRSIAEEWFALDKDSRESDSL